MPLNINYSQRFVRLNYALFCSVQHDEARPGGGVWPPGRRDGQPHSVDLRHLSHTACGDEVALLLREQALLHKHKASPLRLGTGMCNCALYLPSLLESGSLQYTLHLSGICELPPVL